jgi:hypothetical protein
MHFLPQFSGSQMKNVVAALMAMLLCAASAAAPSVRPPFDLSKKQQLALTLVNRYDDQCEAHAEAAGTQYRLTSTPQSGHARIAINKLSDSYTRKALSSVEDVMQTNALDFAQFDLYPDGRFQFSDPQLNMAAYRAEKAEIMAILDNDSNTMLRSVALGVSMQGFEGKLEQRILSRYGILFDFGQLAPASTEAHPGPDPAIFHYLTMPAFAYQARYDNSGATPGVITTVITRGKFKAGGRCDPAVLSAIGKDSLLFSMESEMCAASELIVTSYRYDEQQAVLRSIGRLIFKTIPGQAPSASCVYVQFN